MTVFEFTPVDTFFKDMNRGDCFDIDDMDGQNPNFKVVLCSECAEQFINCIDQDGTLKEWDEATETGVSIIETFGDDDGTVVLSYQQGINLEFTVSVITNQVYYDLGDYDTPIKALFLVSYANGSGYVLAYCIMDRTFVVKDDDLILNMAGVIVSLKGIGG